MATARSGTLPVWSPASYGSSQSVGSKLLLLERTFRSLFNLMISNPEIRSVAATTRTRTRTRTTTTSPSTVFYYYFFFFFCFFFCFFCYFYLLVLQRRIALTLWRSRRPQERGTEAAEGWHLSHGRVALKPREGGT